MTHCLIVFDAGTGAGRCTAFDSEGHLLGTAYQEWDYFTPSKLPVNVKEFDPDEFWKIFCSLCRQVISDAQINPNNILAVSTTSQREGMVFLDKFGKEIYAGPNIDNRGKNEYLSYLDKADTIQEITGLQLASLFGPARLLWFKINQPKLFEQIDNILMISDWIAYRLCGEISSEYSIASSSQLLDIKSGEWSPKLLSIFGLKKEIFPEVFRAGTVIGTISKETSLITGLPENVKVVVGGGDTQMGMLGIGITQDLCISAIAGTSTPVMATINTPFIDPNKRVSTSSYITPGIWALESNAGMTGMSLRWVRDHFANDIVNECEVNSKDPYEKMNELASELEPGSGGWNAYLGSSRAGSRHSNIGGFFFPLNWILDDYDRRHLIRASIETMAFGIRANFDQLSEITRTEQKNFRIGGGQTKSTLFNSILANTLNKHVVTYEVKESTSLGAAICAAVGTGVYPSLSEAGANMIRIEKVVQPDPSLSLIYNDIFKRWIKFGDYISKF